MRIIYFSIVLVFLFAGCMPTKKSQEKSDIIKAYSLDFNWGTGGPNSFPNPGKWADVSTEAQIKWYKDLGVNTIQTFCVSCNGYAWYKNGMVPVDIAEAKKLLRKMIFANYVGEFPNYWTSYWSSADNVES
jgi:hypothetical protein